MPDPRRRPRRLPAVVAAAALAFGALGAVWSVVAPLGEAPDETAHLALVLHVAAGDGYPEHDGLRSPASTYRLCNRYVSAIRACPRPGEVVTKTAIRHHPRAEAPPKGARPTWEDNGGAGRVGRANQMPQHPPLYYQAMATVLRVERAANGGEPRALTQELALLRLFNALLLTPLPALAWWGARRFGLDETTSVAAALVPFGVPMLTHIGSTLNNDNLLILLGSAVVALTAGVLRGDRSLRTAVGLGLTCGLALLTKASAVVFPPFIVLAYVMGRRLTDDGSRVAPAPVPSLAPEPAGRAQAWGRATVPLTAAGATTALVSAWWYVGNRIRTGRFAPTVEDQNLTTALRPPGFQADLGAYLVQFASLVNGRFWGSFGWYSVRLAWGLALVATLAVAGAAISAVATRSVPGLDPQERGRGRLLVFLAPFVGLVGFVLARSWDLYSTTGRYVFLQGRYLLPGVVGLALVVAVGVRRAGRWAPFVVLVPAAALQAWALHRCVSQLWGGPGLGPPDQLRALAAYSGWPGWVLKSLAVAAALSGGGLALTLAAWFSRSWGTGSMVEAGDPPL